MGLSFIPGVLGVTCLGITSQIMQTSMQTNFVDTSKALGKPDLFVAGIVDTGSGNQGVTPDRGLLRTLLTMMKVYQKP